MTPNLKKLFGGGIGISTKDSQNLLWTHYFNLGPLLCILYVNELNYVGNEFSFTVHSYANDTTLYIGFDPLSELEDVYERLNCCLRKVQHWMTLNFFKLNVNKSQLLVCGKKRLVSVHRSPISRLHEILKEGSDIVHSSKILGVTPDDQLCFNHMVNDTCKMCFFK